MRLSEFINAEREKILAEWETFARTLGPASDTMDIAALRDHANAMLTAIAADLVTPQTQTQQHDKSVATPPDKVEGPPTAAAEHGADRAERGFTIGQMVSEYRALRASVIRLWVEAKGVLADADVEDLTRFNEAIDQALAESVVRYSLDLDQSKEMFMAILGHDLRTPLGAVITSAAFMLDMGDLHEPHQTLVSRIASSSRRMDRMVGDLLDLTHSRLGAGISIQRDWMNLETAVREVVSEFAATHPQQSIEVSASGDLRGRWDEARLSQVMTNLIGNALEHGAHDTPVRVTLHGGSDEVSLEVHNQGVPIPASLLPRIFDPMKRRQESGRRARGAPSHLGLGLYIAERIVTAHNGRIDVASSASTGTSFTVRLPRE